MKTSKTLENPIYHGANANSLKKAAELRKNMTNTEEILWEKLKNKKLNGFKFRRQHAINQFIADFYCHKVKLVIEVDGGQHNAIEQKEYDIGRTEELNNFGIKVIRFTNNEIENNLDEVLEEIMRNLE